VVVAYGVAVETHSAFIWWSSYLKTCIRPPTNEDSIMFFGKGDPDDSDARYQYKRSFKDLMKSSAVDGPNITMLRRYSIVFVYSLWERKYRSQIADLANIEKDALRHDVFGDLRLYRNAIIHANGRLDKPTNVLNHFQVGEQIDMSNDIYDKIIRSIIVAINEIGLYHFGIEMGLSLDRRLNPQKQS
jgi:hypothetical protein